MRVGFRLVPRASEDRREAQPSLSFRITATTDRLKPDPHPPSLIVGRCKATATAASPLPGRGVIVPPTVIVESDEKSTARP